MTLTPLEYADGMMLLSLAILLFTITIAWRIARDDGYENGYLAGKGDAAQDDLAARRALRALEAPPVMLPADPHEITADSPPYPLVWGRPQQPVVSITAAGWPVPGPLEVVRFITPTSQRGRYPDTDTGTMDALTDTGAIRAIVAGADADIAARAADNAAWLEQWSRLTPDDVS